MKWIRYQYGGRVSYGILEDEQVEEVSGSPFGEYTRTGHRFPLSAVQIRVPFEPLTFYAAGVNYEEHVREAAALLGREPDLPEKDASAAVEAVSPTCPRRPTSATAPTTRS